jgi:hypothetical protein
MSPWTQPTFNTVIGLPNPDRLPRPLLELDTESIFCMASLLLKG